MGLLTRSDIEALIQAGQLKTPKSLQVDPEMIRDRLEQAFDQEVLTCSDPDELRQRLNENLERLLTAGPAIARIESFKMAAPTDEQLMEMNKRRPAGTAPYTKDEVVSVSFLASDNLLNRSNGIWAIEDLEMMAKLYPGGEWNGYQARPLQLDHNWGTTEKTVGFIYGGDYYWTSDAPMEQKDRDKNLEINNRIVQQFGYGRMWLHACVQQGHPVLEALRFGRMADVSTGSLTDGSMICPHCMVDFNQQDDKGAYVCGHMPPIPFLEWLFEGEDVPWADYYILTGTESAVELSLVLMGNLPAATIPRAGSEMPMAS